MIYLDNAATTSLCDAAKQSIIDHLDDFGNPSSSYEFGRKSRLLIEDARERIAKCINAEPNEIYFTSGGSEANTWALNNRLSVSTNIEHHSIVPCRSVLNVATDGTVSMQYAEYKLKDIIENFFTRPTILSCMYVNNEIGTIQPIKQLAHIAHSNGMKFHTDAVQAVGHIKIDVKDLDVDMLSASAHKFNGPKGVGFLYVKDGVKIKPLINGGKQEQGVRGGTENILGIVSMAYALEDAINNMDERNKHIKHLRDMLLYKLLQIPGSHLNGSQENRVVSNINIRFDNVPGSRLVSMCDLFGLCISTGSACNEGQAIPSNVLKAIGLSDEDALNSVRITIGHENTEAEIDQAANIITKLVERIRENEKT